MKKKIAILGSTGSIGKTTFNIIKNNQNDFEIVLLTTNKNINRILHQVKLLKVKNILISEELLITADAESLGDVLVKSVNEAIQQSQSMAASRLEKLTAGLGLGLS